MHFVEPFQVSTSRQCCRHFHEVFADDATLLRWANSNLLLLHSLELLVTLWSRPVLNGRIRLLLVTPVPLPLESVTASDFCSLCTRARTPRGRNFLPQGVYTARPSMDSEGLRVAAPLLCLLCYLTFN